MMRENLFRGKTKAITGCPYNNGKPDGEWVFGYVFSDLGAMKIRQYETDRPECNDYEVDPETVGQYTGLTDKNGVRIFEGDIVHCVSKIDSADMVIIFECGQFRMILAEKYHEYQTNVGYYDINCFAKEVIGNIHDNPELLGGENNGINR